MRPRRVSRTMHRPIYGLEEAEQTEHDRIARGVVLAALAVHRAVGPGLLESVYQTCLAHKLRSEGFTVDREVAIPLEFEGVRLDLAVRADLVVNGIVIVELKSVDSIVGVHRAQLMTQLRLSGRRLGLLINFNEELLRNGIERFAM